jgi:hypothetical protein
MALLVAGTATVWAQSDPVVLPRPAANPSLEQPSPISRLSGVIQFGMPGDQKFIFCDGSDCPMRSRKHLSEPVPASPAVLHKELAAEEYLVMPPASTQTNPPLASKQRKQRVAHKPGKRRSNDCRVTK